MTAWPARHRLRRRRPPARPSSAALIAADARSTSACSACSSPWRHPDRIRDRHRRQDPAAGQHRHPVSPDHGRRDHGDRHGPGHRVPQHRPVGRLARRRRRHGLRVADDRLAAKHPRHRPDNPLMWILALALGLALGVGIGALPGFHHRLHRRPVVHRHARRAAGLPRRRLAAVAAGRPSPGSTRTFQLLGGGAQGSLGGTLTWLVGVDRLRRGHRAARLQPPAAAAVRLPAAADVGRGPARRVGCVAVLGLAAYRERLLLAEGLADQ